jgi:hypothetical protein
MSGISACISFPLLEQNTWDNWRIKRKGLLWLRILEVSSHDELALLNTMVGACGTAKPFTSWWESEREEKGPGTHYPFKDTPFPIT